MTPAPCIPLEPETRVTHVRRPPDMGGVKVRVIYRDCAWGDARPRLMQRAYYPETWQ